MHVHASVRLCMCVCEYVRACMPVYARRALSFSPRRARSFITPRSAWASVASLSHPSCVTRGSGICCSLARRDVRRCLALSVVSLPLRLWASLFSNTPAPSLRLFYICTSFLHTLSLSGAFLWLFLVFSSVFQHFPWTSALSGCFSIPFCSVCFHPYKPFVLTFLPSAWDAYRWSCGITSHNGINRYICTIIKSYIRGHYDAELIL